MDKASLRYPPLIRGRPAYGYTAKTQYRKFETNIPQERNYAATVSIPTFMFSVSDLDIIPLIGLPILLQKMGWAERGNI
jgi:hypothetical protein